MEIPYINLIPNLPIALTAANVYVMKNVTIPVNFIASQIDMIVTQITLLLACVNEPENIIKSMEHKVISSCTRGLQWDFDIVDMKGNQMKLFYQELM